MVKEASSLNGQKFFYGLRRVWKKKKLKIKYCILSLMTAKIISFDYSAEMGKALANLIDLVKEEHEDTGGFRVLYLPTTRTTSEVFPDDFDDALLLADTLAEQGREEMAPSLCDPLMIRSASLRNFPEIELDSLFQQRFKAGISEPGEGFSSSVSFCFACEMYETFCSGEIFSEKNFTNDLSVVPIGLVKRFGLINSAKREFANEVGYLREAATLAFHPEKEDELVRAKGLRGFANCYQPDPDLAACLS
jgi:hypothetical protein